MKSFFGSSKPKKPSYEVHISEETKNKLIQYQQDLINGKETPGTRLAEKLNGVDISAISPDEFLERLIQTKKPQVFAEEELIDQEIFQNTHKTTEKPNWNEAEFTILGDVGISVPVTIYDNGVHSGDNIKTYGKSKPKGELLFAPGAIIAETNGQKTPDFTEVIGDDGKINDAALNVLYERRLLPLLVHANETAGKHGAFVTVPGIGCGKFAGLHADEFTTLDDKTKEILHNKIEKALFHILEKYADKLQNIKCVNFDPGISPITAKDVQVKIQTPGGIPLVTENGQWGEKSSQLQKIEEFEGGKTFKKCTFYSVVAWDHFSWPGNDFYAGLRQTDDGVKAAATNVCEALTGVKGSYDATGHKFNPTSGGTWQDVIRTNNLQLHTQGRVHVIAKDGSTRNLATIGLEDSIAAPNAYNEISSSTSSSHDVSSVQAQQHVVGEMTARLKKKREAALPSVEITYDPDGAEPRVAFTFDSKAARDAVYKGFKDELTLSKSKANPNVLYIKPSKEKESSSSSGAKSFTNGAYISSNGELSVSFIDNGARDAFCNACGINADHASLYVIGSSGDNAIYFHKQVLPPEVGANKIETKGDIDLGRSV